MILDLNIAISKSNGNEDLAKDLFKMLITELPILLDQLLDCYHRNSINELYDIAHKLHGSTVYSGVPDLKKAAHDLEICAKNNDLENLKFNIEKVKSTITILINSAPSLLNKKWC